MAKRLGIYAPAAEAQWKQGHYLKALDYEAGATITAAGLLFVGETEGGTALKTAFAMVTGAAFSKVLAGISGAARGAAFLRGGAVVGEEIVAANAAGNIPPPAPELPLNAPQSVEPPQAAPSTSSTTRTGVRRVNTADWRTTRDLWDETGVGDVLSAENRARIAAGRTPVVDDAWIRYFPGDEALLGERITMHHIGGHRLTVPLPTSRHIDAHMPGGFRRNPGGPGQSG